MVGTPKRAIRVTEQGAGGATGRSVGWLAELVRGQTLASSGRHSRSQLHRTAKLRNYSLGGEKIKSGFFFVRRACVQ